MSYDRSGGTLTLVTPTSSILGLHSSRVVSIETPIQTKHMYVARELTCTNTRTSNNTKNKEMQEGRAKSISMYRKRYVQESISLHSE